MPVASDLPARTDTRRPPLAGAPGALQGSAAEGVVEDDEVVDVLNELLENSRDGEYAFRTCAHEVESLSKLRRVFNRRASHWHETCEELVQMILRYGGSPAEGGTAGGAMHRGWVHAKGAIGAVSELSMLEECERGEDAAVARYRKASKLNLPADAHSLVERQADDTQRHHDHIKALLDEARARG